MHRWDSDIDIIVIIPLRNHFRHLETSVFVREDTYCHCTIVHFSWKKYLISLDHPRGRWPGLLAIGWVSTEDQRQTFVIWMSGTAKQHAANLWALNIFLGLLTVTFCQGGINPPWVQGYLSAVAYWPVTFSYLHNLVAFIQVWTPQLQTTARLWRGWKSIPMALTTSFLYIWNGLIQISAQNMNTLDVPGYPLGQVARANTPLPNWSIDRTIDCHSFFLAMTFVVSRKNNPKALDFMDSRN